MLRKGMFIAAGAVLVIGLLFGRQGWSYVSTAVGKLQQSVKDTIPVEFDLQRARNEIKGLEPEIRQAVHDIAKEEVAVEKLEAEIKQHQGELVKSKTDILRLDNDLKSGSVNFVYHERNFTRTQVEEDLTHRFENHKTKEKMTKTLQGILAARQKGLSAARQKLENLMADRKTLLVQVENLEAEHRMIEVAKQTSDFNLDDSKLSRTKELLEEIKTRLQVEAKMANATAKFHEEIPLDEPESDGNVSEEIAEYFNGTPESSEFVNSEN